MEALGQQPARKAALPAREDFCTVSAAEPDAHVGPVKAAAVDSGGQQHQRVSGHQPFAVQLRVSSARPLPAQRGKGDRPRLRSMIVE